MPAANLAADSADQVTGETVIIEPAGTGNWQEMLDSEAAHPPAPKPPIAVPYMPAPVSRELSSDPAQPGPMAPPSLPAAPAATGTLVDDFAGLGDNNVSVPPDTMGAAGPSHLMVMLNTQVRIQSKAGTNLGTVTLDTFWTSTSGFTGDPYDPRLIYDSLSGRWMAVVDVDPRVLATSRVWFAISSTNDPTGTWTFYEIDADTTNTNWADFPDIGTNNTWIAISNNMYDSATPANFGGAAMWVIDKSTALAGGALTVTTWAAGFDAAGGAYGFALRPALTFDAAEGTLYIVDNAGFSSGGSYLLRLSRITGTAAAPAWSVVPGSSWGGTGFFQVANNFAFGPHLDSPQLGSATGVMTNDARLSGGVSLRNGRLWVTHSGGLPVGAVDRTAVFWYQLNPGAMPNPIVQSGVIDGGAGVHHFFPSIAANANNDVTIGFSRGDATRYVQGVFAGRESTDAAGTVGAITVCKAGEDSYLKDFGSGVRWGDYSATVIDPVDDLSFWTIQEYAETDVGPNPNDDRWGTWWCLVQYTEPTAATLSSLSTMSGAGAGVWGMAFLILGLVVAVPLGAILIRRRQG